VPATLVVISEPFIGRRYEVGAAGVIGRDLDCDVRIEDPTAAPQHARLFAEAQGYAIESLGDTVLVNGKRIGGPTALAPNDRIHIGEYVFAFQPDVDILPQEDGERAVVVTQDGGALEPELQLHATETPVGQSKAEELVGSLTSTLATSPAVAEILPRVMQQLSRWVAFDAAAVLAVTDDGLDPMYIHSANSMVSISQTMVRRATREHHAIIVGDAQRDSLYGQAGSVVRSKIRSVLVAPLMLNGACAGAVYLTRDQPDAYGGAELELLLRAAPLLVLALSQSRQLASLTSKLRRHARNQVAVPELLGSSPPMTQLKDLVQRAAAAPSPVLISGETGTGKELIARALHTLGRAPDGPFVAVNCGAIPEHLLESEFFGHQRGAFTGADRDKPGRLELAAGGTLFLDEVGDLALGLQVKLLRALEDKSFYRVGGVRPIKVQFRLIAATHRDLKTMVQERTFREDLYFRLNVLHIANPPLRGRGDDIDLLVRHFLDDFARELGKPSPLMHAETLAAFRSYRWPGNVRELRNVIERIVVLCDGPVVRVADLPLELQVDAPRTAADGEGTLPEQVAALERRRIIETLRRARGRKVDAARVLGISRPTLDKKIREYEIDLFEEEPA
jgi:DNA-binding NtrC family response regulator